MTRLKLEINLQRLLKSTETLSRDDSTASNWRLERVKWEKFLLGRFFILSVKEFVKVLSDMLADLQKRSGKPDPETLNGYRIRIEFLEKLVNSQKIDNPVERVVALQMMSQGVSSLDGISREIKQKTASKCNLDIRNELFGLDKVAVDTVFYSAVDAVLSLPFLTPLAVVGMLWEQPLSKFPNSFLSCCPIPGNLLEVVNGIYFLTSDNKSELRHRREEKSTGEDLDSLIKYHQSVQENILNDMLLMTRDLKEQSKLAGTIINKDIETLHKSTGLADQNLSKLKVESARLDEHRRAWRCWMWLLIFVVMMMFIFMVLFIKVTKKRTYSVK